MSKVSELFTGCRTYRRFKQDPMPVEVMKEILDVCRTRSCGRNCQSLKFYAVMSEDKVKAMNGLVKFAGSLPPEIGTPKEGEWPVAYLVIVKTDNAYALGDVDAGIAVDAAAITAWDHGFGSCIMAAINTKGIGQMLGIAENESVKLALALGKPDHKSTLVDVPEDGKLTYYVDENVDYYVPKKAFDEVNFIV